MTLASERRVVQNPLIRYAEEAGWTYLPPDDALCLRHGPEQPLLLDVLTAQLQRLNPGVVTSAEQAAAEVIDHLVRIRPDIEGNREVWEYLKGLKTVFVQAERRERNLRLLDPEHVEANTFHVTDEFRFHSGPHKIRADVVFLVNGIPVILVETKAATRLEGIAEAFDQIRRYHEEAPDLLAQTQLFALTHLMQFFYGATWSLSRKALFNWREEQGHSVAVPLQGDFETLVKSFVAPRRVLRVLTDYILFSRKDGELSKIVLRPHQMRAVERCLARAHEGVRAQRAAPQRRRGLIWHTQGSGKTYTMLTLSRLLLETPTFQNPTVLLIVDRNELQSQLFQNLESVGFGHVHMALSKRHLRDLLKADTRGIIVSMIHKFDDIPGNLTPRANVFVLVDEAHRTTGGDLGNYLMGALPNATFIGFTGTPIDRTAHGKGTFKTFGADDPQGYLDKYSIRESIEDGTTVPLHYQLAPNDLIADRDAMEKDFWAAAELEGVADVEELNRVLDRAVTLTNMLKNRERVEKIARFVAEHFRKYVEPMGYKAFLVAVDREACCFYKEALDRYLPSEASAVVISPGFNDPPHLKRQHLRENEETRIRKAFRKPCENPQILIVTEKLLTGYDAPILYCMYLDKPMRDHVLLQAIARVNRPYESEEGQRKTTGLIVDFVGVFENLERALAFDSQEVSGVVEGLEVLQARFTELMEQGRREYGMITTENTERKSAFSVPSVVQTTATPPPNIASLRQPGQEITENSESTKKNSAFSVPSVVNDKTAEAVLEYFRDKERREAFYAFFCELQAIYEILSPDPFLRPFLKDYERLVEMYRLVRSAYEPHVPVDKSFLRKTAEIVQQHTLTSQIREPHATHEIGTGALLALLHEDKPDTVKVFNLLKEMHRIVAEQGNTAPHLIPIGERAEEIRRRFEERLISAQEALQDMDEVVRQLKEAQEERRSSKLSPQAFAVEWWLRTQNIEAKKAAQTAASLEESFDRFSNWLISVADERELRTRLYKNLLDLGVKEKEVVAWADRIFELLRRAAG
ncbi:MAG TPA: HsdR family type I site-specific deoxyribonuclease [Candidatus Hydrogenedentes bacterium]|mgnify:CR=1 FL=1|nr:HsdR family type I site-specific deoxyribonuclease [Candidatus Hydrogenedentota bacterium]HOL77146.1 HsdR family type I site-specific deoxyribonuclease [Candidatus Hydrogenedentota bacterium]